LCIALRRSSIWTMVERTSMKRIMLAGLPYDLNLGDPAIFDTTKRMIEGYFEEKNKLCRIYTLDLRARTDKADNHYGVACLFRRFYFLWVRRAFAKILMRKDFYIETRDQLIGKTVEVMAKELISRFDPDAVIFAGGGLIKYKTQRYLINSVSNVLDLCRTRKIPVMCSAIGIEDADLIMKREDKSTNRIMKALQDESVKWFTTRDDLEALCNMTTENPELNRKLVADPVCSISMYIPRQEKNHQEGKRVVGLGAVRGNLFISNGIRFNEEQQIAYYVELYKYLYQAGFQPCFFTNGLKEDKKITDRICQQLSEELADKPVVRAKDPSTVEQMIDIISGFDALISGRMHAAITAYSYDIVALGLVANNKIKRFFDIIGYTERALDPERIDPRGTLEALQRALEEGYKQKEKEKYMLSTKESLEHFLDNYVDTMQKLDQR